MFRYLDINRVPRWLGPAVHRKMFRSRDDPEVFGIVPLQPGYKSHAHASSEKRIFAVSLLPPSPAWIAKDVDIRRPEVQALHNVPVACLHSLVMFSPSFSANNNRHLVNQGIIK